MEKLKCHFWRSSSSSRDFPLSRLSFLSSPSEWHSVLERRLFGWFITFERRSSANFESAVLQLVDYLIHWYITLVRYENKEKRLSRSGETRYPFIRAIYVCMCCVMQYYEEVAEIKMYEVNCGRLFESVFLFRRIYFVPISVNVFFKTSVIFLKKKKKILCRNISRFLLQIMEFSSINNKSKGWRRAR